MANFLNKTFSNEIQNQNKENTHTKILWVKLETGSVGKESTCNAGNTGDDTLNPWVGKIPWRRAWQPTPIFLPGELHGQRSLVGYSP